MGGSTILKNWSEYVDQVRSNTVGDLRLRCELHLV